MNNQIPAGIFLLALGLGAGAASAAAPDIVGIQAGMSPGDAYNAIRAFDTAHRVKMGQVAIPQLLGAKPAVYAMAPETENSIKDDLYVNLTLPPNPQQVWQIHRAISGIPNTLEQIVASLLQRTPTSSRSANTWCGSRRPSPVVIQTRILMSTSRIPASSIAPPTRSRTFSTVWPTRRNSKS
jgi:hypothetical protein